MRKKIAVRVGLVAAVLAVTVCVMWLLSPGRPQLRVGMAKAEVDQALGLPVGHVPAYRALDHPPARRGWDYYQPGGWLGDNKTFTVYVDDDDKVVYWESANLAPPSWPDWLDRALEGVGL
jgi:hypothetical protein